MIEDSAIPVQSKNTDREIWREREGDFYADSIHVTWWGTIGLNCGGHVIVMPIREWHALVSRNAALLAACKAVVEEDGYRGSAIMRKRIDAMRAAIAQAEGKAVPNG